MSRRRSQNPTRAISITLPSTLLEEIDDKLTRTQSRSAYIANAVRAYMDEQTLATVAEATNIQLLVALVNRGFMTKTEMELIIGQREV